MQKNNEKKSVINIGTSLMIVVLIGLSFAVIAALAVSSSKNNYDLATKQANHTTEYYQASNQAYESIAADDYADKTYDITMNDSQTLHVEVAGGEITCWQVVNDQDWEGEDSLSIHLDDAEF